jgi:DNA repair protein RadA/Sms
VGLAGEIRSVAKLEKRVAETEALGFKKIIVPQSSLKRLKKSNTKIKVIGVSSVKEVFSNLF